MWSRQDAEDIVQDGDDQYCDRQGGRRAFLQYHEQTQRCDLPHEEEHVIVAPLPVAYHRVQFGAADEFGTANETYIFSIMTLPTYVGNQLERSHRGATRYGFSCLTISIVNNHNDSRIINSSDLVRNRRGITSRL